MTPEQHRRIGELYHNALELAPVGRRLGRGPDPRWRVKTGATPGRSRAAHRDVFGHAPKQAT